MSNVNIIQNYSNLGLEQGTLEVFIKLHALVPISKASQELEVGIS